MSKLATWRAGLIAMQLKADGVIAYPTEGVWGLGCLPQSARGVSRILDMKQRSWQQGLLLVAADIDQVEPYLEGLEPAQRQLLESNWPGPVTYLIPDNGCAPNWIVGTHETVGIRVSSHPVVRDLCRVAGPLVSTSANMTSRPAARTALEVRRYFGRRIDYLVPGDLGSADGPSQIRVLTTGEVVR